MCVGEAADGRLIDTDSTPAMSVSLCKHCRMPRRCAKGADKASQLLSVLKTRFMHKRHLLRTLMPTRWGQGR